MHEPRHEAYFSFVRSWVRRWQITVDYQHTPPCSCQHPSACDRPWSVALVAPFTWVEMNYFVVLKFVVLKFVVLLAQCTLQGVERNLSGAPCRHRGSNPRQGERARVDRRLSHLSYRRRPASTFMKWIKLKAVNLVQICNLTFFTKSVCHWSSEQQHVF